jgi:hypothetical protein
VRVIVVDAVGPAFSGGHDLSEMIGRDVPFYQRLFGVCTELMETIQRLPQPVIAKVEGMATAAGCQLVAACDLAVVPDAPGCGGRPLPDARRAIHKACDRMDTYPVTCGYATRPAPCGV